MMDGWADGRVSENGKCDVREREDWRMAPRLLVGVAGEMVVSPRENGRQKGVEVV